MINTDEFLRHYGKKGMKWGSRKSSTPTKTSTKIKSKKTVKKLSPAQTAKKLSDGDLKKAVTRLQMEKQYSDLSRPTKNKSAVKDLVLSTSTTVVKSALTAVATQQVNAMMQKIIAKK